MPRKNERLPYVQLNRGGRLSYVRRITPELHEFLGGKALLLGTIKKGRGRGGAIALGEGIEGGSRYEAPSAPTANPAASGLLVQVTGTGASHR